MHEGPAFAMLWLTIEWKFMQNLENILPTCGRHSRPTAANAVFRDFITSFRFSAYAENMQNGWVSFIRNFIICRASFEWPRNRRGFAVFDIYCRFEFSRIVHRQRRCHVNVSVLVLVYASMRCTFRLSYVHDVISLVRCQRKKARIRYSGPKISRNTCWIAHLMR